MKKIAIIMGSDSDWPVVQSAAETLQKLEISFEARVLSAHRTPLAAIEFARNARENGFGVIIAAAGRAAHLAGVLAGNTTLPVIGIPIGSVGLGGMDALLSTVQMPSGIPVATVAIDGASNAALLAAEMLALSDKRLETALDQMRADMATAVEKKNEKLQEKIQKISL
ncbi:MAG: 5-(carboxyamino)imidazole ribonucleotide mutase [Oscillospiraceae bacterium]|nr:5-(carboxyamino)imidazole ribonucleotide mutase [Oscillospiraceae bacterium]